MKKIIFAILIAGLMVSVVFCSLSATAADFGIQDSGIQERTSIDFFISGSIDDPSRGGQPWVKYTFTYSVASPGGDDYYIMWDWGDGNVEGWYGPYASGETATAKHAWMRIGDYYVQVKIKFDDGSGWESDWRLICLMKIRWFDSEGILSSIRLPRQRCVSLRDLQ